MVCGVYQAIEFEQTLATSSADYARRELESQTQIDRAHAERQLQLEQSQANHTRELRDLTAAHKHEVGRLERNIVEVELQLQQQTLQSAKHRESLEESMQAANKRSRELEMEHTSIRTEFEQANHLLEAKMSDMADTHKLAIGTTENELKHRLEMAKQEHLAAVSESQAELWRLHQLSTQLENENSQLKRDLVRETEKSKQNLEHEKICAERDIQELQNKLDLLTKERDNQVELLRSTCQVQVADLESALNAERLEAPKVETRMDTELRDLKELHWDKQKALEAQLRDEAARADSEEARAVELEVQATETIALTDLLWLLQISCQRQLESLRIQIDSERNGLTLTVEAEKRKAANIEVDLHRQIEQLHQTSWKKESDLQAKLTASEGLKEELEGRIEQIEADAKRRLEEAKRDAEQAHEDLKQHAEEEQRQVEAAAALHAQEVAQLKKQLKSLEDETRQSIEFQVRFICFAAGRLRLHCSV